MGVRVRIGAATAVGALGVAAVAGIAVAKPEGMAPRAALVSAHSLTIKSQVGSFCTQSRPDGGTSSGVCADAIPAGIRGHLPVRPQDAVRLRFRHNPNIRDRVRSVHVALAVLRRRQFGLDYVGHARHPVQNPIHASRWKVTLPNDLRGANVLEVDVLYPGGDAQFWAGIAPGD
jgi:hypothetical protein